MSRPTTADRVPAAGDHVDALDGLRGVAVLLVVLYHCGFPSLQAFSLIPGWIGVDLFFALSGFLITTLLLQERRDTGAIRLGHFWVRRFLRLMPAYYAYVGLLLVWMWLEPGALFAHGDQSPALFVLSLLFYFVNFVNEVDIWDHHWFSIHLWSLSLEEQFYLLWPVILVATARWPRVLLLLCAILLVGVSANVLLRPDHVSSKFHLWGRGTSVLSGCTAAAATFHMDPEARTRFLQASRWAWAPSLAIVLVLAVDANSSGGVHDHVYLVPAGLAFAWMIAGLWYSPSPGTAASRVLSRPLLVGVGRVSYGVYLYHMAVQRFVWSSTASLFGDLPPALTYGLRVALCVALSLAAASISFRFLEAPALRMKRHFRTAPILVPRSAHRSDRTGSERVRERTARRTEDVPGGHAATGRPHDVD